MAYLNGTWNKLWPVLSSQKSMINNREVPKQSNDFASTVQKNLQQIWWRPLTKSTSEFDSCKTDSIYSSYILRPQFSAGHFMQKNLMGYFLLGDCLTSTAGATCKLTVLQYKMLCCYHNNTKNCDTWKCVRIADSIRKDGSCP